MNSGGDLLQISYYNIPPHLKDVAALPCEAIMLQNSH